MATYVEMAPIIEGVGITKISIANYFSNIPEEVVPTPPPEITKAKVVSVADAYLTDSIINLRQFCAVVGLKRFQIIAIIKEIKILKSAWLEIQAAEAAAIAAAEAEAAAEEPVV